MLFLKRTNYLYWYTILLLPFYKMFILQMNMTDNLKVYNRMTNIDSILYRMFLYAALFRASGGQTSHKLK